MGDPKGVAFDLPRLRTSLSFENDTKDIKDDNVAEFFDVKFCPYQPLDCDPIFAAVSKKHVILCRLISTQTGANPCQIISLIRDDDGEASNCCCTWVKDPQTGAPYLCIGGVDAKVKIYDLNSGKLVECFTGHGGDVNDLATSPVDPSIVASASDDTTIRIWSLDPKHKEQPCLCILAGEGHSATLLTLAFHNTGRYMLSAGYDQLINMWTIPDLPKERTENPIQVHYPHFSTAAVHSGIIDCVSWYGDQILSRACHEDVIVLWRIEGFCSTNPPPSPSKAPPQQIVAENKREEIKRLTRSAFVPTLTPQNPAQYTRLVEFSTPGCGPTFFLRFKLFHAPDSHPVLAFGNASGKVFFWDLQRLSAYHEIMAELNDSSRDSTQPVVLPPWLKPVRGKADTGPTLLKRKRDFDKESEMSAQTAGSGDVPKTKAADQQFSKETLEAWAAKYSLDNPHKPLKAHRTEYCNRTEDRSVNFVGRQAAWSPSGEWCVVVGSLNVTLILQRWGRKAVAANGK